MRRVVEQLQQQPPDRRLEKVDVGALISQVASQCAEWNPTPRADVGGAPVWVRADRERLSMALFHAIRNAQDATEERGSVVISLETSNSRGVVRVIDTGSGMDEVFIRERLFRPFDSTKGPQGMGIGAYQIRETIRAIGGEIIVVSEPGEGTEIILELPMAS